ncbi:anamorsin homolog [Sycon ciliatum]|uniref:anamorsin homolog n=1 Tax=Sycon ciliatum TaxID=27933 RepID=UPI0020AE9F6D|eukprot:scpid47457/ scgid20243/ Anamorsin homolog; Fe-S cluster assembly protein DRE2 homolog
MEIPQGEKVLLVWAGCPEQSLLAAVEELKQKVGAGGDVSLENAERLEFGAQRASSYGVVLAGVVPPCAVIHSDAMLEELSRVVSTGGQLVLREPTCPVGHVTNMRSPEKLHSALVLSGFTNVSQPAAVQQSAEDRAQLCAALAEQRGVSAELAQTVTLTEVRAQRPAYEVGASSALPLSFAKKATNGTSTEPQGNVASVWKLSANDLGDDDIELMDEDDLLDESDKAKPDPSTLRVCGTTGKRKACKDCSCGLAEELAGEKQSASKPTSACGSCYLGDAFRCASCPYLGMPAFKPGDQVRLSDRQLKADA